MQVFEFDNNNMATIEMPILTQADQKCNEHFSPSREKNRNSGFLKIGFFSKESGWDFSQDPSAEQLKCLEFIKENQNEILKSLFEYTKDTLYPVHIGFIGFDEVSFPEINQVDDLRLSLGINSILFFYEHKDECSYCAFDCDFSGDYEHGVKILMNKLNVLGWEEDLSKEKVLKDLQKQN